ncbi:MAG: dockerin type I repeat-containing protein [Armatimonadetes bacterium]|nr:dockerin type I repeat-containing protein [Armatimonadota bacterium]
MQKSNLVGLAVLGTLALSAVAQADYQLLVTQTFAGFASQSQWNGIKRYYFTSSGAPAAERIGIDKSLVADPASITENSLGEFFVGNRSGNTGNSLVSRFTYNLSTDTFIPNGSITGNGLSACHAVAFNSSGEMFVADAFSGFSRFTFPGGVPTPNGTISKSSTRWCTFGSDPNKMFYAAGTDGLLRIHNIAANTETNFNIAGSGGVHWGAWLGNDIYIASASTSEVYKITFSGGMPVSSVKVANYPVAISVAFSPDGKEMYVGSHTGNKIGRFMLDSGSGTWVHTGDINFGWNVGSMAVVSRVPTAITISGNVDLQDYFGDPASQKVDITFKQNGIEMETVKGVSLDTSGNFSFQTTRRGTHQVLVKGSHWLRSAATGTFNFVEATNVGGVNASLINGDIDGDNTVTIFDYVVLSNYFDRNESQSDWHTVGTNGWAPADADLDGDGSVTIFDYLVLSNNFDVNGD